MKVAYVHLRDHQDPIWNKAFEQHYHSANGDVVRSYSEREEMQFDRELEILSNPAAKIEIEQSSTLRKYLERNPEKLDAIKQLIADGRIGFMGGGEAIIDYNVVIGESIYRNFLQGLRWMQQTLGKYPQVACANDTFGLSAQLPQILRQYGFRWLPLYSRGFGYEAIGIETEHVAGQPVQPYWRGIDGSLICIKREFADQGVEAHRVFVNYQYLPCPECHGEGCRFCEYVGLDFYAWQGADCMEQVLADFSDSPHQAMQIFFTTEETAKHPDLIEDILTLGERYGIAVEYVDYEDLQEKLAGPYLAKLDEQTISEEQIDIRVEANPIGTGCYTTRSILKRTNRELEHLLLATECFSTLAAPMGMIYPREMLAKLWQTLSVTQAHDALTGNHPDGTFHEMMTYYRTIRRGAGKRLMEACRCLGAHIEVPEQGGVVPVAVFNTLAWNVDGAVTEIVIHDEVARRLNDNGEVVDWRVTTLNGESLPLMSWKRVVVDGASVYRLQCVCRDLPACGYVTVMCQPIFGDKKSNENENLKADSKDVEAAGIAQGQQTAAGTSDRGKVMAAVSGNLLENDRYRVCWGDRGLTEIYDKTLGKVVAGPGSCDLWAMDDIGSLWETIKHFDMRVNLNEVADVSVRGFENRDGSVKKLLITGRLYEPMEWKLPESWTQTLSMSRGRVIREATSDEAEVLIHTLNWEMELWLLDGLDRIDVRVAIDCDSENIQLRLPFMFGFKTEENRAWYEIPYGMIERPSYQPMEGVHNNPDGSWPAVHWAAAVNESEDYTCAVLNRGVPGYRYVDGVMVLTLLRSSRLNIWQYRSLEDNRMTNPLAKDSGRQVYELAFVSGAGGVAANQLTHRGYEFNRQPTAITLNEPSVDRMRKEVGRDGSILLGGTHSFYTGGCANIMVSALKLAEDSTDMIVRMAEVYGQAAKIEVAALGLAGKVYEVGPMEDGGQEVNNNVLSFRPFEVKTLRIVR